VLSDYHDYPEWLHSSTRISVHPLLSSIPIYEEESDDEDPYNVMTSSVQLQRAPLENYMVRISIQL
jgi:hypothetical protein